MALTRKMLKAMGIEDEKIDEIVDAHAETVDALKKERNKYKEEADKLTDVQKKYDDLKKVVDSQEEDPYKAKYDKEHKAFEEYKAGVESERTKANKTNAYRELLKKAGVSDKRIDSVLKVTAIDEIELDDEGKIKDADNVMKDIQSEWSEFIEVRDQRGAGTENPPRNVGGGTKLTKADIYKKDDHGRYILSTAERQKALIEMSAEQ